MRDLMDNQVSYERLHHNCTKSQHSLLHTGYLIVYHLDLVKPHVDNALMEKSFLGNLDQALVGNDKYAEIPGDPGGHHNQCSNRGATGYAHQERTIGRLLENNQRAR